MPPPGPLQGIPEGGFFSYTCTLSSQSYSQLPAAGYRYTEVVTAMVTHRTSLQIIHTEKCERVFPPPGPLQSPPTPLDPSRHPRGALKDSCADKCAYKCAYKCAALKAPPRHPQGTLQGTLKAPKRDTPRPFKAPPRHPRGTGRAPPRHPRGTECLLRACEDPCWLFFHTLPHPSTPFHTLRAPFQTPHKAPHHKAPTRATTRDREGQHTRTAQGTCKAPQGPTRAPQGTYIGLGAGHTGNATYIGDP